MRSPKRVRNSHSTSRPATRESFLVAFMKVYAGWMVKTQGNKQAYYIMGRKSTATDFFASARHPPGSGQPGGGDVMPLASRTLTVRPCKGGAPVLPIAQFAGVGSPSSAPR